PSLAPYDPFASDAARALQPPSLRHWFGTDALGRDMFSRVLVATRLDMAIAISSVILAFAFGTLAGLAAGFLGGATDQAV
ncbi:ABC transporter permease, partial [Acinetobacter baumannii]